MRTPGRQPQNSFSCNAQSRRALRSDERGQSIVIVALVLFGLVAFAGLVFDGGTAFAERRRMQNAAEAGALAGAYELAFGGPSVTDSDVCNAISEYVLTRNAQARYGGQTSDFVAYYIDKNGKQVGGSQLIAGKNCGSMGGVPEGDGIAGVMVTSTTAFNTFFLNVLGVRSGTVSAKAKAIFGAPNNVTNVSPIMPQCLVPNPTSMLDCGFKNDGTIYDLWDGGGPGNFGWATWNNTNDPKTDPVCSSGGGSGTPLLCENLVHPERMQYTHKCNPDPDSTVSLGDCVDGLTGVKNANDVRDALNALIANQTKMLVPIWAQATDSGGNLSYKVVSFATFVVTGFVLPQGSGSSGGDPSPCYTNGALNGGGNCIAGYFVDYAKVAGKGDLCTTPSCSSFDTGTRTIGLIGP